MSYNIDELVHHYVFSSGTEMTIDTSFVKEFSEIKKEVILQTPEANILYSEYPKGFKILMENYPDRNDLKTNFPLKEVAPNQFVIEFPLT